MKRYAMFMLAAMLTIGLSATAQNGQRKQRNNDNNRPRQEMRMTAKERADWMSKQLELTTEQTVKVQALLEKQDAKRAEQIAKQREQTTVNREKSREEMRTLREKEMKENQAELESIIGKEKMEKLNSLRESRQERPQATRAKRS